MESPMETKSKAELFAERPDDFVDMQELIVALKRTDKGPALYLNPRSRSEMTLALGELQVALVREAIHIDMANLKAKQDSIIPAKGGIINAARNRMFGKRN
jgi:hypothetical protein